MKNLLTALMLCVFASAAFAQNGPWPQRPVITGGDGPHVRHEQSDKKVQTKKAEVCESCCKCKCHTEKVEKKKPIRHKKDFKKGDKRPQQERIQNHRKKQKRIQDHRKKQSGKKRPLHKRKSKSTKGKKHGYKQRIEN